MLGATVDQTSVLLLVDLLREAFEIIVRTVVQVRQVSSHELDGVADEARDL